MHQRLAIEKVYSQVRTYTEHVSHLPVCLQDNCSSMERVLNSSKSYCDTWHIRPINEVLVSLGLVCVYACSLL